MNEVALELIFAALLLLLVCSAFFSASETALMAMNRYRLLHLAREGHRGARLAARLLEQPQRLIGLILLGNNFVNILASALATVAFVRIAGEGGVLLATVVMTVVVLIFAEVAPKTLAAFHPERVALPAAHVLSPLLVLLQPLIRLINAASGLVLLGFGHRQQKHIQADALNPDELQTLLREGGRLIPEQHRQMLLNILALEEARVEDIMIPRRQIRGIDLDLPLPELRAAVAAFPFGRAIVYRGRMDDVLGVLNTRTLLDHGRDGIDAATIQARMRKPYFVLEGTRLPQQLREFQKRQRRSALVVNEYGDLVGLITLSDILEEIVGEFTSAPGSSGRRIEHLPDGSLRIDGRIALVTLNRRMGWNLPSDEANTLSGLITERLQALPRAGEVVEIQGLRMQPEEVVDSVVVSVRVVPGE